MGEKVYTDNSDFSEGNTSTPTFSHHKLTCFEYADGVNLNSQTGLTDLNMYYYKLSLAYGTATDNRNITDKFPASTEGFAARRPEFEIVGAFAADPITLVSVQSGDGSNVSSVVTVTTEQDHNLDVGTPIKISGVVPLEYNVSSKVASVDPTNSKVFTYTLESVSDELTTPASNVSGATATVETDTVGGASPYIFNISFRSVYGMCGLFADGSKATGFKSMVVAQYTGIGLQKDNNAFVKYDKDSGEYKDSTFAGNENINSDSKAVYKPSYKNDHIKATNDAVIQCVSVFAIGYSEHLTVSSGGDLSVTNSNSNFGSKSLVAQGFKKDAFARDDVGYLTHIIPPKQIETSTLAVEFDAIDVNKTDSVAGIGSTSRLYLYDQTNQAVKPATVLEGYRAVSYTHLTLPTIYSV